MLSCIAGPRCVSVPLLKAERVFSPSLLWGPSLRRAAPPGNLVGSLRFLTLTCNGCSGLQLLKGVQNSLRHIRSGLMKALEQREQHTLHLRFPGILGGTGMRPPFFLPLHTQELLGSLLW